MAKNKFAIGMRALSLILTLAAAVAMRMSYEKVDLDGLIYIAKYHYWSALLYFVYANAFCTGYNFLVLLLPSGSQHWRTVLVFDVIFNMLNITSVAVAWECFNSLKKGNVHSQWSPVCHLVPGFCGSVLGAFITGAVGFAVNFILLCYSFQALMNFLLLPDDKS